ncbi:MAG: hypothetical protein QNJ55_13890 [Xenococcus sp. MO_188.B8]|nr:hypothetical protein [Xenococcus sp. MO_188.B8]
MNKIVYIIAITLGLAISTEINAQETTNFNISQEDFEILKTLACTGDNSDPKLQTSLVDIESLLSQTLTSYGLEIPDEQLESLGTMATDAQLQLELEETVKAFCNE